jgi:acetylornithine deacetylase
MSLRQSWAKQYQNPAFMVDIPTMNLASIHGGDAPNRICSHCELRLDVRLMPGMQSQEIREIIRRTVEKALEGTGVTADCEPIFGGVEAFSQPSDSDFVKVVESLTGHPSETVAFATEAPFLQQLGMQTVVLGPGSIDCAHKANEYLDLSQIKPAVSLLKSLIQRYCLK